MAVTKKMMAGGGHHHHKPSKCQKLWSKYLKPAAKEMYSLIMDPSRWNNLS
jgi:hypothetical protein